MDTLFTLILALIALFAASLLKAYRYVPLTELKRRARRGDELAKMLYKAAGYGASLSLILWIILGCASAGFFVVSSTVWPSWLAFLLALAMIYVGFYWIPTSRVVGLTNRLAAIIAPALAKLLEKIFPLTNRLTLLLAKYHTARFHTGLYERSDLIKLLDMQAVQADNRIEKAELSIAKCALTFGDKLVRDILVPRRAVAAVAATETVGPILMAELHKSGHSRFPVYEGRKDKIIGVMHLRDAVKLKKATEVKNIVHEDSLLYAHESQPLSDVLQNMLEQRHHLYIVLNEFEEYVGIVTLEDIMEQILGRQIVDESDTVENVREEALKEAEVEHLEHIDSTQEETTVVEYAPNDDFSRR